MAHTLEVFLVVPLHEALQQAQEQLHHKHYALSLDLFFYEKEVFLLLSQ